MRPVIIAVTFAAIAGTTTTAAAGCCAANLYDVPPAPIAMPPAAINPVYVVNRGPVLQGPGVYSYTNGYVSTFDRPTYSDGSYTYPEQSYYRWSYPYAYPYAGAGYGFGCGGYRHAGYGCGAYRSVGYGYGGYSGCGYGGCGAGYVQPTSYGPAYPAYRRPLYAPYRYRPALRVRAMHVRSKGY